MTLKNKQVQRGHYRTGQQANYIALTAARKT